MTQNIQMIRDRILDAMLPRIPVKGWVWEDAIRAAGEAGYQDTMPDAVFPAGLNDIVAHFSDLIDRRMLEKLTAVRPESMRVRERIREAVLMRFGCLESCRPVMRASLGYWSAPGRVLQGQRVLWRTADRIWEWAGDTAGDYNRQTKRALLCSILLGSSMVWIEDNSEGREVTAQFVDRRIENVMAIGAAMGKIKQNGSNIKRQTS